MDVEGEWYHVAAQRSERRTGFRDRRGDAHFLDARRWRRQCRLVCLSVHDGKILWRREIDHTTVMPPEQRALAQADRKLIAELRQDLGRWREDWLAFEKALSKKRLSVALVKAAVEAPPVPPGDDGEQGLDPAGGPVPVDAALKASYLALTKEKTEKLFADLQGFKTGMYVAGDSPLADAAAAAIPAIEGK